MTDTTEHSGEPQWADQYRGLESQLDEARRVVAATRPSELIEMTDAHVDALDAMARLADEQFQIAKKFLIERDSPPPRA